jgi:hypothetical protein
MNANRNCHSCSSVDLLIYFVMFYFPYRIRLTHNKYGVNLLNMLEEEKDRRAAKKLVLTDLNKK